MNPKLTLAAALATAAPSLAVPAQEWVPLTPGVPPGTPAEIVLDQTQSGHQRTVIDVKVHGYFLLPSGAPAGLPQNRVVIPGLPSLDKPGKPALPRVPLELLVVTDADEAVVTLNAQGWKARPGVGVAPAPVAELDEEKNGEAPGEGDPDGTPAKWFLDQDVYGGDSTWPPLGAGAPPIKPQVEMLLGTLPCVETEVHPARWNPTSHVLEVAESVHVVVDHAGSAHPFAPVSKLKKQIAEVNFDNWNSVSQYVPGHGATYAGRYLFVYPDAMYGELLPLIHQKQARGFATSLITIESTTGDCAGIESAIDAWYLAGTPDDLAGDNYVLLVGDIDRIPLCLDPVDGKPTDDLYASTVGDDLDEEVWLGRLSIDDATDLENQVAKILAYEDEPEESNQWEEVALVAHEQDAPGKYEGAHEDVRTYWSYDSQPTFLTFYGSTGTTDAAVSSAIEDGLGLVCYRGHGSSSAWTNWSTNGDDYHKDDVIDLAEPIQTPVVWSIACSNQKLDHSESDPNADCLGETFLEQPESGGVAHYGATRVSYTDANHELDRQLFRAVYGSSITKHAAAISQAESAMTSYSPTWGAANSWRYLLLGDPEMTVRRDYEQIAIDPPGGFDPGPVLDLDFFIEDEFGNEVEDVLVSAWMDGGGTGGGIDVDGYTDASGKVTLTVAPQVTGLMKVYASDGITAEVNTVIPVGCGPKPYGEGLGGANIATLTHLTGLSAGDAVQFGVAVPGGTVGTQAFLALATQQASLPLFGGTVLIDPSTVQLVLNLSLGLTGEGEADVNVPKKPGLVGLAIHAQAFAPSAALPGGFALSNGIVHTLCPIGS